ncbi:two-component regulator propeller domain-containing protein [Cyclobacterium jeungdonense]|uniref:histidine kinase n=1 Tax=Cyclobacterium jeungdonense TaxID=708087 RepID=A0ABT8CDV7_9BACT|nr:two-component regulator propeller domain-containing protein [Cyclobacterium jeungdonense]MDN3690656.1 two-component regulator propeller domain-containing protein [Cyclobacterium jeungdonense]
MNKGFLLLRICFGFLLISELNAQDRYSFKFKKLETDKNLSSGNVQAIFQDKDGYMWLGTNNGLNRFDGSRIKNFFADERDSSTISSHSIYKIFQGPEGNVWFKDFDKIVNVYLKDKGIFERDMDKISMQYKLRSSDITRVFEDSKKRYWFLHPYEGISLLDSGLQECQYFFSKDSEEGTISSNLVTDIQEDPNGDFWLVHANGSIDILSGRTFKVFKRIQLPDSKRPLPQCSFEMVIDQAGDAWVFCPDYALGVFWVSGKSQLVQAINESSEQIKLNNSLVKSVLEYAPGQIWIATDHGGINIIDTQKLEVHYELNQPENPLSLSHNAVYALYLDADGIVWVGTHKRGVDLYHPRLNRFGLIKREIDPENPIPKNDVNAIEEDAQGNIIVGSNGGGLWRYDPKSKFYLDGDQWENQSGKAPGSDVVVVDLLTDQSGTLWIGTYQSGLYKYDGKNFTQFEAAPGNPAALQDNNVWKIFEDSAGRLWVGTLREGLFLMDRKSDTFTQYTLEGQGIPLNNQYITGITEDKEGNIWVGGGRGIDVFHPEKGYQQYFSGGPTDRSGLSNANVSEIIRDSFGTIWVSTGKGLFYFDEPTKSFKVFDQSSGLKNDFLVSLVPDKNGDLWLSSQNGLIHAKVNRRSGKLSLGFRYFTTGDGLQGDYFNKNAAFLSVDGRVYFGGADGINYLEPETFPFFDKEPKVVFTGIQLFNQPVGINESVNGRVLLEKPLDKIRSIRLKHHENLFTVAFSSLNYLNPEKSSFLYRLDGFSKNWVSKEAAPFGVTFTNLDPGTYTLQVRAASSDGVWGDEVASLTIEILTPFWLTPLAYLVYGLVFLVAFFFSWKWFVSRERQRLMRVEEIKENKRLAELDQMKNRFFTNVSHEFRTPLTLILAPIEKLLKDKKEEGPEGFQLQTIQKNAQKLLLMVNQLLEVRKLENDSLQLVLSQGDMVTFIEEQVRSFQSLAIQKQIGLTFSSNVRNIPTAFDTDMMGKMITNLLSNAFKFTPVNGEINVSLDFQQYSLEEGFLEIRVRDSGIGIAKDQLDRIFERYVTLSSHENQGTGIGLALVREYAKVHGGTARVYSVPGQGATFTVSLPLKLREGYLIWEEFFMDAGKEELIASGRGSGVAMEDLPTMLLVEDNSDLRLYLAEVLKDTYTILQASNGREALQLALRYIPDIILSDVLMPEMDGVAFCQAVKTNIKTSHVPVVLLTARTADEDQLIGLKSGCNLYLDKPFNLEILRSSLTNLLKDKERLQKHYRKFISVQTSEAELESLDDKLIQKAVALVEKEIENPEFSVEILSKSMGMSRVHLYKKINSLTGQSPLEFIRTIRLQRAAQLLGMNQYTVAEVAYKVGYNNAKYFSKHFKANYGKIPSQYQKDIEND